MTAALTKLQRNRIKDYGGFNWGGAVDSHHLWFHFAAVSVTFPANGRPSEPARRSEVHLPVSYRYCTFFKFFLEWYGKVVCESGIDCLILLGVGPTLIHDFRARHPD